MLVPVKNASISNVPAAAMVHLLAAEDDALRNRGEGVTRLRCIQEAGDMVLLPPNWGHMTYNLKASIGVAKEFIYHPLSSHPSSARMGMKKEKRRETKEASPFLRQSTDLEVVEVTVPIGVAPGDTFEARLPDDRAISVEIPPGAHPGQRIKTKVPRAVSGA